MPSYYTALKKAFEIITGCDVVCMDIVQQVFYCWKQVANAKISRVHLSFTANNKTDDNVKPGRRPVDTKVHSNSCTHLQSCAR